MPKYTIYIQNPKVASSIILTYLAFPSKSWVSFIRCIHI